MDSDDSRDVARKIGLTIFLLKAGKVSALQDKLVVGKTAYPLRAPLDGEFIPVLSAVGEPVWVEEIRSLMDSTLSSMNSQSPGGILVVRRSSRTFVITFGHAWQKLEDEWLEPDFGRRVALNSIRPGNLLELRAEQVFARWHIASERAPRASSIKEFGVEVDRDLVAAVEGVPSSKSLGLTIRGGTNLRLNLPILTLGPVLDEVLLLYESDAYMKEWPEIDNITPVRDEVLIAQLDAHLDADLKSGVAQKRIVLFTPAHRRDELSAVDSYVFGRMTKAPPTSPYLMVSSWLSYLDRQKLPASVESARNSPIHLLDGNKEEIKVWTVYDCFGYEVSVSGKPFVLSSGTWYEVVPDFLSRINLLVKSIDAPKDRLVAWDQKEAEGAYNLRCSKLQNLLHFDAKNVNFGGGQSKFEFCDLADVPRNVLYFVKICSKSSGMSHLLEQVRRTAELLFSLDDAYRNELSKVFAKHHAKADRKWLKSRPRAGDWQLCLVSLGRPASRLPFFAKCGLARLYNELGQRGHDVSFLDV
jgi:uncharacterized protein (TIGR04141 family)